MRGLLRAAPRRELEERLVARPYTQYMPTAPVIEVGVVGGAVNARSCGHNNIGGQGPSDVADLLGFPDEGVQTNEVSGGH